jgi:hypothetical protein
MLKPGFEIRSKVKSFKGIHSGNKEVLPNWHHHSFAFQLNAVHNFLMFILQNEYSRNAMPASKNMSFLNLSKAI